MSRRLKRQITAQFVVYEAHIVSLTVEKLRGANSVGTNDVSYNCTAIASWERTCSSPDLTTTSDSRRRWWKHVRARYESLHERLDTFEKRGNIVRAFLSQSSSFSLSFSLYTLADFYLVLGVLPRTRNVRASTFETIGNFFNLQSANEQMLSRRWFPDLTRCVKSHRRAPKGWEKRSPSAPPPLRIPADRGRRNDVSVEISFRVPGSALQQPERRLNNWGGSVKRAFTFAKYIAHKTVTRYRIFRRVHVERENIIFNALSERCVYNMTFILSLFNKVRFRLV